MLFLFFIFLSIVITLPTSEISVVVAVSLLFIIALESNTEKNLGANVKHLYKKLNKEINSNSDCNCKVRRAITMWGTITNYPKLLSQLWKKIISLFGGTNNIFVSPNSVLLRKSPILNSINILFYTIYTNLYLEP